MFKIIIFKRKKKKKKKEEIALNKSAFGKAVLEKREGRGQMNNEGFEEWDASFLEQVIQVEELALSSSNPTQHHHHHHPPPPPPPVSYGAVSYSPPRELSQRVVNEPIKQLDHFSNGRISHSLGVIAPLVLNTRPAASNAKDREIDSLKVRASNVCFCVCVCLG